MRGGGVLPLDDPLQVVLIEFAQGDFLRTDAHEVAFDNRNMADGNDIRLMNADKKGVG